MSIPAGTRLGPYQVLEPIGAGSMGEVCRARDERLGRDVAIKVMSAVHALDAGRRRRFEREAHVLSSLNHPNIAALIGVEQTAFGQALVMELVDGNTLADYLALHTRAGSGLPLHEALPIARQIAAGLEAAHEHGIIHRDLKPSNVALRADGAVKILDFGLAKAIDSADVDEPTATITDLAPGAAGPGTPAYMSPEQARGLRADKRSDIWAFGCVLYELLTGQRAFPGDRSSDVIAKILEREPDLTQVPTTAPPGVRRLLRRCLEKDPHERLRDIGDARIELQEALADKSDAPASRPSRWAWRSVAAALVVGIAAVAAPMWLNRANGTAAPVVTRFAFPAEVMVGASGINLAIAPDGSRIVYASRNGFIVRSRDQLGETRLAQAIGVPFVSPDGRSVGFIYEQVIWRMPITGGAATALGEVNPGAMASWSPDGIVVSDVRGLHRLPDSGGALQRLAMTDLAAAEQAAYPQMLPGGRAVLFTVIPTRTINVGASGLSRDGRIEVLDLMTNERRTLIQGGSRARFVATGHLIYAQAETLMAVPFDPGTLQIRGEPVAVLSGIARDEFAIADDGTLVYLTGGESRERTLMWVDRQGREEPVGAPDRDYVYPRLSPDGRHIALDVAGPPDREIYLWDMARRSLDRFTVDPAGNPLVAWSPDGQSLAYGSDRFGPTTTFMQPADRHEPERRLVEDREIQMPIIFTPDGDLLISQAVPGHGRDIYLLKMDGRRKPEPLVATPGMEGTAHVSADGRWLAYDSSESGQFEVYVRPFPDVGTARWQISTAGGRQPMWSRDGRELFYRDFNGALLSVSITRSPAFAAAPPMTILPGGRYVGGGSALGGRTYDLSLDGRRFLMLKAVPAAAAGSVVVVVNWFEELKRRIAMP